MGGENQRQRARGIPDLTRDREMDRFSKVELHDLHLLGRLASGLARIFQS